MEVYPPNLLPVSLLTRVIVAPLKSHFSWNFSDESPSIEDLNNKTGHISVLVLSFSLIKEINNLFS